MDMAMKRIILSLLIICGVCAVSIAQTTPLGLTAAPSIMVIPSDNWCSLNGFMKSQVINGVEHYEPEYRKALLSSPELKMAISTVNRLMTKQGFNLVDLESTLKTIETEAAENSVTMSSSGSMINESPRETLARVARADLIFEMSWHINKIGPQSSVQWTLRALDSYSLKEVASAGSTSAKSIGVELSVLLEESIASNMPAFLDLLQGYFTQLKTLGREISLEVRIWDNAGFNFESDFEDDELGYFIKQWVKRNAVGGTTTPSLSSPNVLKYTNIRIPNVDAEGYQITASDWIHKLSRRLKKAPSVGGVTEYNKGLGTIILILGQK